jgi:hypothetical protein
VHFASKLCENKESHETDYQAYQKVLGHHVIISARKLRGLCSTKCTTGSTQPLQAPTTVAKALAISQQKMRRRKAGCQPNFLD